MKREKNYKTARLIEALEYIDIRFIEEAAEKIKPRPTGQAFYGKPSRSKALRQFLALAACVLLLSAAIPAITYLANHLPDIVAFFIGDETTGTDPELTHPETPSPETSSSPETTVNTEPETTAPLYEGTTAEPEAEYDGSRGLLYKMSDDGKSYYLAGMGTCTDENIVVASTYDGYPVTVIGEDALAGYDRIKSITIPESVTAIDMRAFKNCTGLESVVLHDGISYIGADAFENCVALTEITLPKSLEWIQTGLFMNCINLQKVIIGNEVERIVFGAFYDCSALRELHYLGTKAEWNKIQKDLDWNAKSEITVVHCSNGDVEITPYNADEPEYDGSRGLEYKVNNDGKTASLFGIGTCTDTEIVVASTYNSLPVTEIFYNAFNGNSQIVSVIIPESVTFIEERAFANCSSLQRITLPSGLKNFGEAETFKNCTSLKTIVLPDGMNYLGVETFKGCTSLESIVMKGVGSIDTSAFEDCVKLNNIVISGKCIDISHYAFKNCRSLTKFSFDGTVNEWLKLAKGNEWSDGCPFTVIHCSDGDVDLIEYDGSRGLEYRIEGDHAVLVGIGTCTDNNIVVASTYNGLPVKVIGERALYYEKADSIRVSDTIEIIEEEALGAGKYSSLYISASVRQLEGAFSTCDKLEKIEVDKNNPIYQSTNNCLINTKTQTLVLGCINSVIPADGSVTVIGNKAFEAARFTNITIPEGITEIGEEAFAWCVMLESIVIPDSVKTIGDLAFTDCERAKTLKLGKSIESIGNGAFYCCFMITEIELPQSVKTLGSNAFANTRITSLVIPDGVKFPEGAHNMFASCDYLESIVLPSGIESFGSWFLGGCENLKSITIPSSVKAIGDYAFYGCSSLKEIIIPEGVTEIGEGAFKQCTRITSIVVPESVKSIGNKAFAGCTELVSITLPSSITEIASSTFSECTKLRQINIPSGVASIGSHAFKDCTLLEALTLPDSVKTIGEYTFNGCSALKDIDLGEGLESIGTWAFENCTSLKQIVLPESMKDIAHHAFVRSGLESVRIPKGIKRINDGVFGACVSLKDVSLPEGLTEIGYSAFSYCTSLETLVIPNTVTMIGGEIFNNCTSLKSLTIPSSVKTLQGSQHFMNCTSLTNMTIPEGITMQFEYYNMFDGCTSLASVTLPRDLPRVSREIFKNCSALTEINYGGSIAQWNSLKKQDNWNSGCAATVIHCSDGVAELYTSHSYDGSRGLQYKVNTDGKTVSFVGIGACTDSEIVIASNYDGKPVTEIIESALADNTKITGVIIPNSVLKIGQSAFARCAALKSIEIPDSVKTVGSGTFYQCTALESVKFGSGIAELENDMFYKCSALASVVLGENIKKIGAHSFCHCVKLNNVIVPDSVESIEMYAFEGCSSLTEMTLGKGIKALGERSLAADNLIEVSFKGTKENWSSIAFDEKWNLYSGITVIHCSDGDLELYEYDGSRGLEYRIEGDHAVLVGIGTCTDKDIAVATKYNAFPVTEIDAYALYDCQFLESIAIPEGVTVIGNEAFYLCKNLKNVTLPSTLEYIQDWAFANCESLENIFIPDSVKWIGQRAFSDCAKLSSVTLGQGLEQIQGSAFHNCAALKSVRFPRDLKLIEADAFSGCTSLADIAYAGTVSEWKLVDSTGEGYYYQSFTWHKDVPAPKIRCSDGDVLADPISYDEATELARQYWSPIESGYFVCYASDEMYLLVRPDEVIVDRIYIDRYTGEISVPKLTYPDIPDSLLKVLLNETTYIRQFDYESEGYFKDTVLDYPTAETGSFGYAVCDLDGDGKAELILSSMQYEIVLREFEGKVYGYLFDFRSLLDLKTDGSFNFISNAGMTYGTARLSFDGTKYVYGELTRRETADDGSISYFVDDKKVTKEEFDAREALLSQEEAPYEHLAIYPLKAWFPGG